MDFLLPGRFKELRSPVQRLQQRRGGVSQDFDAGLLSGDRPKARKDVDHQRRHGRRDHPGGNSKGRPGYRVS